MRLTWKREERERGLAGVVQGELDYNLRIDKQRIASVSRKGRFVEGWYWYGGDDALGIPRRNTCDEPVATAEEAKVQCMAYVKECLAAKKEE